MKVGTLATLAVLLERWTDQDELLIGTNADTRTRADLKCLIGYLLNPLALRLNLTGSPSFRQLLRHSREVVFGALAHAEVPFDEIVRNLGGPRDPSRDGLFQVVYSTRTSAPDLGANWSLSHTELDAATECDLHLEVDDHGGLAARLRYNVDLFAAGTIESLAQQLCTLIESICDSPDSPVHALPSLSLAERQRLVVDWNATDREYPRTPVHELVHEHAVLAPDSPAVTDPDRTLTFRELDEAAASRAAQLVRLGVGPDVLVGIYLEPSSNFVVALLATLKAGGAHVPLDTEFPNERLGYILDDARPAVILTEKALLTRLPEHAAVALCIDDGPRPPSNDADQQPLEPVQANHLAYVLYTSGSTGRPKGVMIEHGGLSNYLAWAAEFYDIAAGRGAPVHSPMSFDLTVTSLWGPPVRRATSHYCSAERWSRGTLGSAVRAL